MLKGAAIMNVVTPRTGPHRRGAGAVGVIAPQAGAGHHRGGGDPGDGGQGPHRALHRGADPAEPGVDDIDESGVLTPGDSTHHLDTSMLTVPFPFGPLVRPSGGLAEHRPARRRHRFHALCHTGLFADHVVTHRI